MQETACLFNTCPCAQFSSVAPSPNQCCGGGIDKLNLTGEEFVSKLLDRRWMLSTPDTKVHQIIVSPHHHKQQLHLHPGLFGPFSFFNPLLGNAIVEKKTSQASFFALRDDLLHPLVNGNKARKLDGLLPLVQDYSVTDVVTCGGCQSAHAAAVAVSCAGRGLKSHLLLRGEQPETVTGYNLISMLYGDTTYVPRSLYAKSKEGRNAHKKANFIAGNTGSVVWLNDLFVASLTNHVSRKLNCRQMGVLSLTNDKRKVAIVNEGAGDGAGLLGIIRLVRYLSQNHLFGKDRALKIVVDAGTGATAVGLGLGELCLGLPSKVYGMMLADTLDGYRKLEERLIVLEVTKKQVK